MREKIKYICLLIFIFLFSFSSVALGLTRPEPDISNLFINTNCVLLIEKETGDILYEKNAYEKMYPASTTKILTAIIVIENSYLNELVTVSNTALSAVPPSYTKAGLVAGEELSVKDLLYAMLIPSGNDAANVLAEHISGSIPNFANLMNKKAKELGLNNSNFTNPSGIHSEELYSTAYDLSILARYAMNLDTFMEIVKTESYTLPATSLHPQDDRVLHTTNLLLNPNDTNYYYQYATGIKTGFTNNAGDCLVASSKKDNIEFIAVCLKASYLNNGLRAKFLDCKTLFDFAFDNYTTYYNDLQEENKKAKENLEMLENDSIQDVSETEASNNSNTQNEISHFDILRIITQVISVLIIIISIKLLFFRKKKNRHRLLKKRKRK